MRSKTTPNGPGRCGQCKTTTRPVFRYAEGYPIREPDPQGRWLCDRCVVELRLMHWELTAWGTTVSVSHPAADVGTAAVCHDGPATPETTAEPWADDTDDEDDDRARRRAEARQLSAAIAKLLRALDTSLGGD